MKKKKPVTKTVVKARQIPLILSLLFLSTFTLLCCLSPLQGQNISIQPAQQIGLPNIQNFTPADYDAHPESYDIAQDQQGIMYFANINGLLQYDGSTWTLMPLLKGTSAYSVGCTGDGVTYVGGVGELGYLAADEKGRQQFQSLLEKVPEQFRDFTYVWQIAITKEFVYFMADKYLLRWKLDGSEAQLKAWPFKNIYHNTFVLEDELYVWEWSMGLEKMVGDSLQVAPGGAAYERTTIRLMVPWDETGKLFIGTVQNGFSIYDRAKVEWLQTPTPLKTILNNSFLYNSLRLKDGNFALASYGDGIILSDPSNRILQVLNESSGLVNNQITDLFTDRSGALWASTNNGISRLDFPSPFTYYSKQIGLTGDVKGLFHFKDRLYSYGTSGFFQLSQPTTDDYRTSFKLMENVFSFNATYDVMELDGNWMAAGSSGIVSFDLENYKEDDNNNIALKVTIKLLPSRFHPRRFYAMMSKSIGVFERDIEGWKFVGQISGFPELLTSIVETSPQQLWATCEDAAIQVNIREEDFAEPNGLIKATPERAIAAQLETFNTSHGLPQGFLFADLLDEKAIFATTAGIRHFNVATQSFEPYLDLPYTDTSQAIIHLQVQESGNIWFINTDEDRASLVLLKASGNGTYTQKTTNFEHIYSKGINIERINEDPADPNIAWISTSSGLIKYNAAVEKDYEQAYPVLIRRVLVNNDSLIHGGTTANSNEPTLTYDLNSMRFAYTAPTYETPDKTEYQIRLEGFDQDWSPWTTETRKDYTNLPEGNYTFRVRAKNIFGTQGKEGLYSFAILPPWYRTWWAYLIYLLVGLLTLAGIVYFYNAWRTRRLIEQNLQLERKVAEQTEALRANNEKLKELDQLKSQFFTNISHEFRTPLTIISGMADQIKLSPTKWLEKGTSMIKRNSSSLLHLINQILDLRKLEKGGLQVDYVQGDIIYFLRYLLESFHALAEERQIKLHFLNSMDSLLMDFDKDKMMQIITNLLSNALKFTPEKGNIYIRTEMDVAEAGTLPHLHIKVQDTGIGIAEDKLPHVFDRFFQVQGSNQQETSVKKSKGSGIGLSLVKELVYLLKGRIQVNSEVGSGTTFHLILPITNEAPMDEEQQREEQMVASVAPQAPIKTPRTNSSGIAPLQELEKPQLLIVEDNADVVRYLHTLLEDHYNLQIANNGEEGIETALSTIPDLIISDVMMPLKDGYELCDTLKRDPSTSHIPIVLLTSRSDEESKLTGLEKGADAYLTKPFNPEELFIRLEKLHQLRAQLQAQFRSLQAFNELRGSPALESEASQMQAAIIERLRNVIEDNMTDEDFGVTQLCRAANMSRTQLHRKLKSLTNLSTSGFIRAIRMQKAKALLQSGQFNVTEVAFEVGISDPAYFSRSFSREFGQPPSDFLVH